jgi:hypothetical protein
MGPLCCHAGRPYPVMLSGERSISRLLQRHLCGNPETLRSTLRVTEKRLRVMA